MDGVSISNAFVDQDFMKGNIYPFVQFNSAAKDKVTFLKGTSYDTPKPVQEKAVKTGDKGAAKANGKAVAKGEKKEAKKSKK